MEQSFTTRTLCHSGISSKLKAAKVLARSLSLFLSFPEWLIPCCLNTLPGLVRALGQLAVLALGTFHVCVRVTGGLPWGEVPAFRICSTRLFSVCAGRKMDRCV